MTDEDVAAASPTDPQVEYIPWRVGGPTACGCPWVECWFGGDRVTADGLIVPTRHQIKVLHARGCSARAAQGQPIPVEVEAGVEHLQANARLRCWCPRHVVADGHQLPVIVLRHLESCEVRHPGLLVAPPIPRRLPAGVIPCPRCGNVAFSLVDGHRRCDGPNSCGHVWDASGVAA